MDIISRTFIISGVLAGAAGVMWESTLGWYITMSGSFRE